MKKIVFLMPAVAHRPTGGFKVIYEYANRFSDAGYEVVCCYSITPPTPYVSNANFFTVLFKHIGKKILNCYTCRHWFQLNKSVKEIAVWNLKQKNVPPADIYIATAVRTAYFLQEYKIDEKKQKKFYFIQDYENWGCPNEFVDNSYKLNLRKIVISDWLLEKVKKQGQEAVLCYNGFDFDYFKLSILPEYRNPYIVSLLYHENYYKRCQDALQALEIVKQKYPELRVNIFGQYKKPNLPEWYTYYRRPDRQTHNKLLNEASIFIYSSESEGFCLPPAEAMICGCAVCGTDIPGIPYKKNNVTVLASPVGDIQALAENIIKLLGDSDLRFRIARQGRDYILHNYTWEKSVKIFMGEFEK